jgi:hypothetical protein
MALPFSRDWAVPPKGLHCQLSKLALFMFRSLLVASCLLVTSMGFSQTLSNLKASFDGEKMVVTYDLAYPEPDQKFKVTFYSSHDNYSRALSLVTGDAGESVSPGLGKRVVWDLKNALPGDFDADIRIKIIASIVAGKLSTKPLDKSAFKTGDSLAFRWAGGDPGSKVNVTLFKDDVLKVQVAEGIANNQELYWVVPKGVKGSGYVLRVSNAANESELSNSQIFSIKSRIPLYLKILPLAVLAIGGTAAAVAAGGGDDPPAGEDELPGPVKPN